MDYPAWVEFVRYLGLDPITVWFEYRTVLIACLAAAAILSLIFLWWLAKRLLIVAASYRYTFADRQPFFRNLQLMDPLQQPRITASLSGEPFVYAMPAIHKKTVGFLILSPKRLIFLPKEGSATSGLSFPLSSFPDANITDNAKNVELKLIQPHAKPIFKLLGVSRDHAQELFMKMHAFRQTPNTP